MFPINCTSGSMWLNTVLWCIHSVGTLGNKLLYGHVQDPFPQCGMGSDHTTDWIFRLYLQSWPIVELVWNY